MSRLQQQRVIEIFELLTSSSQQQEHATSASAKRSASALSDKSSKSDTKARSSDTSQLSSDLDEGGKRNSVEKPESVLSVLRDLKKAIICLEQQLSRQESQATAATFPPQLPAQMITVPPDGLCLSLTLASQRFIPRNCAMSMEKQAIALVKSALKSRQRSVRRVAFVRKLCNSCVSTLCSIRHVRITINEL